MLINYFDLRCGFVLAPFKILSLPFGCCHWVFTGANVVQSRLLISRLGFGELSGCVCQVSNMLGHYYCKDFFFFFLLIINHLYIAPLTPLLQFPDTVLFFFFAFQFQKFSSFWQVPTLTWFLCNGIVLFYSLLSPPLE